MEVVSFILSILGSAGTIIALLLIWKMVKKWGSFTTMVIGATKDYQECLRENDRLRMYNETLSETNTNLEKQIQREKNAREQLERALQEAISQTTNPDLRTALRNVNFELQALRAMQEDPKANN